MKVKDPFGHRPGTKRLVLAILSLLALLGFLGLMAFLVVVRNVTIEPKDLIAFGIALIGLSNTFAGTYAGFREAGGGTVVECQTGDVSTIPNSAVLPEPQPEQHPFDVS